MIRIRRSGDRGRADHGWLDARHTFSFGSYHDPEHVSFRSLRVLNEDRVAPKSGFAPHPHENMEILTHVISGSLEHEDSMGNGSTIRPGEFQVMTAGTGVVHSEKNPSADEPLHLLQIWILPERNGLAPGYGQRSFPLEERRGNLRLVASPDGADSSLRIHQDARVYSAVLEPGGDVTHAAAPGRHAWVQVVKGEVKIGPETLAAGDGAAISDMAEITLSAVRPAEVLLFDLA